MKGNLIERLRRLEKICGDSDIDGALNDAVRYIERLQHKLSARSAHEADAARIDLFERNARLGLSCDDDEDAPWVVHRVGGSRNDREWAEIGRGATARAAIDDAIAALSSAKEPDNG